VPAAVRLWTWELSPFAGKVRVALAEKGVELELAEVHPVRRPPRLRELNPANRVPVLELDDGRGLRESSVICEWVEETWPEPPLWPADPADRAEARGWARWIDDELTTSFFLAMRKQGFGLAEGDPPDLVDRLLGTLAKRWKPLEAALGRHDGPWLGGEGPSYADLGGAPLAVRLPEWRPDLQPEATTYPLAAAWLEALRARPSAAAVRAAGPERLSA
jgi:glutathione S-transferase